MCWMLVGCSYFLISRWNAFAGRRGRERAGSVKQSSVVRMGMSKQHNHLWGTNYVLQRWPGGGGGGGGGGSGGGGGRPTLLQTAGAAHHLTADSYGRCDPILPRPGRSRAEPSGGPGQSQQTSKTSDTGGRGKTTWRRRWRRGWWATDASALFSLAEVGQTCCLFFPLGARILSLWRTDFLSVKLFPSDCQVTYQHHTLMS